MFFKHLDGWARKIVKDKEKNQQRKYQNMKKGIIVDCGIERKKERKKERKFLKIHGGQVSQ